MLSILYILCFNQQGVDTTLMADMSPKKFFSYALSYVDKIYYSLKISPHTPNVQNQSSVQKKCHNLVKMKYIYYNFRSGESRFLSLEIFRTCGPII